MVVKSLSYILLLIVPGVRLALLFILACFLFGLSFLVWTLLWLPDEVLTFLFFLHCENEDFSILMKDILFSYS